MSLTALLIILLGVAFPISIPPSDAAVPYMWKNVTIGGGGYVLDVYCHPKQRDLVYIRTDVGGFYRWDPAGTRWIPLTDQFGPGQSNYYGGEGMALDPNDPKVVYIAAGKTHSSLGTIFKSVDGGRSWGKLPLDLKMGGNEEHRWGGERLVVSPFNSKILLFGSRSDGLWRSADAGESWSKVAPFAAKLKDGIGFTAIAFSLATRGVVFAASYDDGVYESEDEGLTWQRTPLAPEEVERLVASPNGALYATHRHGVGKWTAGQWTDVTPTGVKEAFCGFSVNPQDPKDLITTTSTPKLRLFRSRDGGKTWTEQKTLTQSSAPWYSGSMKQIQYVAGLTFDPCVPGRVWLTDWYATYETDNINADPVVFRNHERGHEELVVFTLACPPGGPPLLSGTADVDGFVHENLDDFPIHGIGDYYGGKGPTFGYTEQIAWCPAHPERTARAGVIPWNHSGGVALSKDGGRTWTAAPAWDSKIMAARIAIGAADPDNMVVLGVGAGPAVSTRNGGISWQPVTGLPDNLVPDVWNWQTPLVADGLLTGVFYLYHNGKVYKSIDGGATFGVVCDGLPGWAQSLVSVPGKAGELWLAMGDSGLYHSTDAGSTFSAVLSVKRATLFALGKP
ncbi:MAG: glycoside hydrolase, partial [Armatimonadota bacterium]|nr:glycoside hydrolase [Armatimonadota bacterium]